MLRAFADPSLRRFLARTALPIMVAVVAAVGLAAAVLIWSAVKADQVAIERQKSLVALVVSQVQSAVAHDQESATVWDDAVEAVHDPARTEWIDSNLGTWMHTYFGHDGAFVLDAHDQPIYAFSDGAIAERNAYGRIAASAALLVADLRRKLAASDTTGTSERILSAGAAELATVEGRPAVISVKPIISDTGNITQTPGEEYLHVALRFLDDTFLAELRRDYLFDGLRFSRADQLSAGETDLALHSASGALIGYFLWQPYKPGTAVMSFMVPALSVLFLLVSAAVAILLVRLRRRSLKLQASEAEVHHLAMHDPLTGLANRTMFNQHLDAALRAQKQNGGMTAVLYLDLDRFKQVNDTLGHATGDELICQFAGRLREIVRSGDTIARIGGDEFTIALFGVEDVTAVESLCRRILGSVTQPFDIDGNHISVGVSIGVSLAPTDGTERSELARKADIALYHAKSAGRGRFAMFGKDMDAVLQARRGIEHDLREALNREDGIDVFFQPLYSAQGGLITGVEALARWRHFEQGWISPTVFIPVAEESGLIEKLGEFVLRRACQAAKAWPIGKVAVNVSAVELRNPHYAVKVANVLLSTGMSPYKLELEVTESALTDDNGTCDRNISALRELGVQIALDDFGTGFSSLSRLQRLSVDRIKIDRSFVQGLSHSGSDEAIVQAIVSLAKATGLKTTAEGVETSQQGEYLRQIGCDDVQGFFLSKPVSEAEMMKLLPVDTKRQSA